MEFINGNRRTSAGEMGNIVFTDLYNYDMPLIRYEIGDLGVPTDAPCPCGSQLPVMEFFAGRETDVFVTPDGSFVPGVSLCDRIIEDCEGIEQLQFIQNTADELTVKIVKGRKYTSADMNQLDARLYSYFQGRLRIVKEFVEDIPKEKSGKTRFCISDVKKNL
jgi:phenylacetate-CoA ligase